MRRSAAVRRRQASLCVGMDVQLGADYRGRYLVILGQLQLVFIDRVDRENIVVRLIALGRARAVIAVCAEIGSALDGAFGHQLGLHIAGVLRNRRCFWRNIEHNPMPETAAARLVRIVNRDRETLRVARRAAPAQGRRNIAAFAASPIDVGYLL